MPAKHRAVSYDDDSGSSQDISVDEVYQTKIDLDEIKNEREAARTQLQKDLDKKIASLQRRVEETTNDHTKQLGAISKQKLDRLIQAIEARDVIDRRIREKLAELKNEATHLVDLLDQTYEHRIQKTQRVMLSDAEELQAEDPDGAARPTKKVRLDT